MHLNRKVYIPSIFPLGVLLKHDDIQDINLYGLADPPSSPAALSIDGDYDFLIYIS
jgi:hypothetical protein